MLTTPILYSKVAFDATKDEVFKFNVIGGDRVVANTLTIKNNTTNEVVYSENQVSYRFEHTLNKNTLTNGVYYEAQIKTFDALGNSIVSNSIEFWCFTTPILTFTNIPSSSIIDNSSFSFDVLYSQKEAEPLNSYEFKLYDNLKQVIFSSGVQFVNNEQQNEVQYLFSSLLNNTNYYVGIDIVTKYGTEVSSDLEAILVRYSYPTVFSNVSLTNNCHDGNIIVQSNVQGIFGISNPENIDYQDGFVDLSQSGSYVKWDDNFNFSQDWTIKIWGKNFNTGTNIFILKNGQLDLLQLLYQSNDNNTWVEMYVKNNGMYGNYQIKSNLIGKVRTSENVFIFIRKIDNLYDLAIENLDSSLLD